MKTTYDLSSLDWHVSGWTPHLWRLGNGMETGATSLAEVDPIPAPVPGSVQEALRRAGVLPDWNIGLQAKPCEWVENRHWIYDVALPDDWLADAPTVRLVCLGLDYAGVILLNGQQIAAFTGSQVPHTFDLSGKLKPQDNRLQIVFEYVPRWLGQFGYTSQMTEWKPRFNYTWDWISRLVQIGIWDRVSLEVDDGDTLGDLRCRTDAANGTGQLWVHGSVGAGTKAQKVHVALERDGTVVREETMPAVEWARGVTWDGLDIELWQPAAGQGAQPLYTLHCTLQDGAGGTLDTDTRRVGFKAIEWRACEGAVPEADPWICVVNGRPIFLQGVNWTPIRPNFADVTDEDYRQRLVQYRDLGCNLLRVWGGAFLEKQIFYDLCDELGLLVWQEFPLSSSGIDNWAPEDETSIEQMAEIARSYIARRQHHASLLLWCGGNELQGALDGGKQGIGKPLDLTHPLITRLDQVVALEDPSRRFLATSSSGPRFGAEPQDYGKGLHWDVHGPWQISGTMDDWTAYWAHDDALFRSETGAPGASGADIIDAYRGELAALPGTRDNPLWRRTSWWIEWPTFTHEMGREPANLEEYVSWSQARQARALSIAVRACKDRFPRCGGILIWMGHDSFPCTANTALIDFWGRPKPAALALGAIFRTPTPNPAH